MAARARAGRGARALLDGGAHPADLGRRRGGGACGETVEYDRALYSGGERAALQLVRESAGPAQVVLVVGHNPTIAMLASELSDGDGSTQAHECLAAGFPTSSVAVLRYSGSWGDLGHGTAVLERCHVCRG